MAEELTRVLVTRANRGTPRGSEAVLGAARQRLDAGHEIRRWWRSVPAFAVAFAATIILVGAVLLASRLLVPETPPAETVPVTTSVPPTTSAPVPSVTSTTIPAGSYVMMLQPVVDLVPIRLSTSIGEIEFTTLESPASWHEVWPLTKSAHGVVGKAYPAGVLIGSLDGHTWYEIATTRGPQNWAAAGDDLLIFGWSAAVRMEWDGTGWNQTDDVTNGISISEAVAGPQGMVAVRGTGIFYSVDGAEFTQATDPPQPSLHTLSGPGCSAPGSVSEGARDGLGPIAAIDYGFVALASSDDDLMCEPWVWISPDGDGWTLISEESPFGEGAFIHEMTAVGDTIVAIGGLSPIESAVWVSADGVTWERGAIEAAELQEVAGGERGWILLGHRQPDGETGVMWFSPDGRTWDGPYDRPPGLGDLRSRWFGMLSVAMLDNRIIGTGNQFNTPGIAASAAPSRVVVGEFIDE